MLADICVIAVVAFFIYTGYRAGLMRSVVRIASYIVSIAVSFFLYPVVSDFLMKTAVYEKIREFVNANYVSQSMTQASENTFGIFARYIGDGIQNAAEGVSGAIAGLLVNIIAFVIILFLSRVIIRIVTSMFNIFTKLPIIKQFNRFGGAVLGGVMGVLVLYIASAVLLLISPIAPDSRIASEIETSVFASEIYENNIILHLIGKEK